MPHYLQFAVTDPLVSDKRNSWLRRTCREIAAKVKLKFKMGEAQYQCDFGDQTVDYLLDQIEQEAIDTLMYITELRRRRQKPTNQQKDIVL
jgi:hypothetical protein